MILDEFGTVVRTDRETGRKTGTLDGATDSWYMALLLGVYIFI